MVHMYVLLLQRTWSSFRGRKNHTTQNVMAAVDFDLRFTYVLAGWEGTSHDALCNTPSFLNLVR
jgi:hypothetical protein